MQVKQTFTYISRDTYSLLDYFGDLGGCHQFFMLILGLLAYQFSIFRMNALISNRLFHLSEDA
jgi:hypothetical protein